MKKPASIAVGPPDPHIDAIPVSARLLTEPQFKVWLDEYAKFMTTARKERSNPGALLDLQADMGSLLLRAQDLQREHRNASDEVPEKICQRLQHIVRQIGDGLAWRALDYDRAFIRVLASKPQTGFMEPESAVDEMAVASLQVERTGKLVVMCDLTNFLRHGDLLLVDDDGPSIIEVKSGEGAAKSGRASRQKKNLDDVLEFIASGERVGQLDDIPEKIITLNSQPRTHLDTLRSLIDEARTKGIATARLSQAVAVQVFHVPEMSEDLAAGRVKVRDLARDPFRQSRDSLVADSLSLSKFSSNVAPYSIFPFGSKDCVDLMTGAIWVVSYVSLHRLIRCLRRRSLWAQMATDRDRSLAPDGNVALVVARHRGQDENVMLVPWASLARLSYELWDEESWADAIVEELDAIAELGRVIVHARHAHERELWD